MITNYTSSIRALPDHVVREAVRRARVLLHDGPFEVDACFERWTRTQGVGQLAAICVNPRTRTRWLVGVNNRNGKVEVLSPVR
jgi:hypothetical protein